MLQYLSSNPVQICLYDVCGKHIIQNEKKLAIHLGLSGKDNNSVCHTDFVNLTHIRPPFLFDTITTTPITFFIQTSAFLTTEQKKRLERFLDRCKQNLNEIIHDIRNVRHYIIYPSRSIQLFPYKEERYSCTGFILEAFHKMGIELINEKDDLIPRYTLEEIQARHPVAQRHQDVTGLYILSPKDTSWPVIFPGYVVRAIEHWITEKESGVENPTLYQIKMGDEYLP